MFSRRKFQTATLVLSLSLSSLIAHAQARPKAFAKAGTGVQIVVNPGRDQIMPFVYDGGGWTTMLVLTNLDNHTIVVHVQFTANDGSLLTLPVNGIGDATDVSITIPPGGNYSITTSGFASQRTSGYAYVSAQNGSDWFGGYGVLRNQANGLPDLEMTAPLTPLDENFFTLSFDNTGGFSTYAALINSSGSNTASIGVSVQDSQGNILATDRISIPPFGRYVYNLGDNYPDVNGLVGNVTFSASGQLVAGSGLRQGPNQSLTIIPPLSLSR